MERIGFVIAIILVHMSSAVGFVNNHLPCAPIVTTSPAKIQRQCASKLQSTKEEADYTYTPPTWTAPIITKDTNSTIISPELQSSLQSLASTTLALLAGDEASASTLLGGASKKRHVIKQVFDAYDICSSGTLSVEEAQCLFVDLARSMVTELAQGNNIISNVVVNATAAEGQQSNITKGQRSSTDSNAARAHAKRVLAEDEAGNTIDRVARKLLILADLDQDGKVNLGELAMLFETIFRANVNVVDIDSDDNENHNHHDSVKIDSNNNSGERSTTFPQPLRALAGSLQLLPPKESSSTMDAATRSSLWNVGVAGDDHTLRCVILEQQQDGRGGKQKKSSQLSLVGLGRSADASAYFLPELGIAFDAGLHVSSLQPRTVLLTHGHRDHIGALPVHNSHNALIMVPQSIETLVHNFLIAEAQLNYGDPAQTEQETIDALGTFNVRGVSDGMRIMLPKDKYCGSPTPIGIEVLTAPHKEGVPAVSYGVFRQKQRLKEEYAGMNNSELGAILRAKRESGAGEEDVGITENYDEGVLFYTGDTTITLLRERWKSILPKYKYIIHEVTFLGPPSSELDSSVRSKGHTHYAQLHPWILAFPETTFICVHWSLRYGKQDVLDFFDSNYGGVPKNVVLWL